MGSPVQFGEKMGGGSHVNVAPGVHPERVIGTKDE